jgi:four helix bundle protein
MYRFAFEKLDVWQDAKELTVIVYRITTDFPENEKFGLTNQMRRAAVSVSSNIAEGASRTSGKDQAHFYQIAYSSLMELLNQFIISVELGYINELKFNQNIRPIIEKISNKINALRKSRLNKPNN